MKMRRSCLSFDTAGSLCQFPPLCRHRALRFQSNRASPRFVSFVPNVYWFALPAVSLYGPSGLRLGFLTGEAFGRFWFCLCAVGFCFSRAQSIMAHVLPFGLLGVCGHRPLMVFVP